jgi:hypothetical protein
MTYTVRAFQSNGSVEETYDYFPISPGAFELIYNFEYGQACLSADYDCPNEQVNVCTTCLAVMLAAVGSVPQLCLYR